MKEKLKAIWKLWKSEEYFLTIANQHNPYGEKKLGPIKYEYFSNKNKKLFYIFVNDHINNLNNI